MADLIDRAKAIKAIEDMQDCYNGFSSTYDKAQIIGVLEEVPTAEPQEGEWEEISTSEAKVTLQYMRCSACKRWHIVPYLYKVTLPNYCPNCGARMEREQ